MVFSIRTSRKLSKPSEARHRWRFPHISEKHIGRYLAEVDRCWTTRKESHGERAVNFIKTVLGKRLAYSEWIAR